MAGPSWLADAFAAVMILIAAYSVSRLAVSRLRGRATEFDADALHAVMGAAMAGMLLPRLNVLPGSVWAAVFGAGAAWFGWHALRGRAPRRLRQVAVPFPGASSDRMHRHALHAPAGARLLARARGTGNGDARHGLIRRRRGRLPGPRGGPRPAHGRLHHLDHRPARVPGPGHAASPVLAPRLAACGRLVMSIAMGYMLILLF